MFSVLGLLSLLATIAPGTFAVLRDPTMSVTCVTTTLDEDFPAGYQVLTADIDRNGRSDVVGLGSTVAWLENPGWHKHPITGNQTRNNIDIAAYDLDGDGQLEIVVASEFALEDSSKGGSIHWFRRTDSLDQPWTGHLIDSYPTTHRLRWADVDGSGHRVLISAPLLGRGSKPPEYDQAPAPLMLYRVPPDPAHESWPRQIIDQSLHVTHGLLIYDFDGDGREEILTASFEGVHLFRSSGRQDTLTWTRTKLCSGEQATRPARGSSEVRVGKLKNGKRFIVTIEPWHGDEVAVYLEPSQRDALWVRTPVDASFNEGHALEVMDVDGDGNDEIIAGFRGKRRGVVAYHVKDDSGKAWERTVLDDGGIACQGFFPAALAPAQIGIVAPKGIVGIGGATHNVRLYEFMNR